MDKLLKVVAEQNEEAESSFQLKRIADAMEEIDSIKNRLDNIEDKLKIVNVIATAMMNRDIRESEKKDKEDEDEIK